MLIKICIVSKYIIFLVCLTQIAILNLEFFSIITWILAFWNTGCAFGLKICNLANYSKYFITNRSLSVGKSGIFNNCLSHTEWEHICQYRLFNCSRVLRFDQCSKSMKKHLKLCKTELIWTSDKASRGPVSASRKSKLCYRMLTLRDPWCVFFNFFPHFKSTLLYGWAF